MRLWPVRACPSAQHGVRLHARAGVGRSGGGLGSACFGMSCGECEGYDMPLTVQRVHSAFTQTRDSRGQTNMREIDAAVPAAGWVKIALCKGRF